MLVNDTCFDCDPKYENFALIKYKNYRNFKFLTLYKF